MQEVLSLHYLYLHITIDNKIPFYIGIGTKQYGDISNPKLKYARAYSWAGKTEFWKKIVRKHGYNIEILLESNNYNYIKDQEIYFISKYGRRDLQKGSLCNLTNGGDGILGHKFSEESKKKMSESAKRNMLNGKAFLSDKSIYKKLSERNKGNQYAKGKKLSQETIKSLKKAWIEKLGRRVIQEDLEGNFIREWYTSVEASKAMGVSKGMIWKACKNYYKKNTCKGFLWKFKE